MATTLITSAGSVVQVINGGQASNVFWAVGSSAAIGSTNTFVGTILAVASITVAGTGTTIAGGLLANAVVNLGDTIVTVTTTLPPPAPTSIAPTSDEQGYTGNVTVTGTNFDAGGTSTLSFSGTGITVNSYGTRDATTLVANITIGITAALTARDVIVTNADTQTGTLAAAFTVTSGTPVPVSISPSPITPCGTFNVTVTGTNFTPNVTENFIAFNYAGGAPIISASPALDSLANLYLSVSHGVSVGGNGSETFTQTSSDNWDAAIATFDGATPTYVQAAYGFGVAITSKSLALTNTAGNSLIVIVRVQYQASVLTIADTQGNVWLPVFDYTDGGIERFQAWYVPAALAGVNTVTVSFDSSSNAAMQFVEYSPLGNLVQAPMPASGLGTVGTTPALTGPSTLSFSGTGITINSYSVQNATTITANITVDCTATLGLRTVTVTNGNGQTGTIGGGGGLIIAEPISAAGPFVSY